MGPKRRRLEEENDILSPVKRREVEESTLAQRLTEYVERIDTDMVRTLISHLDNLDSLKSKGFGRTQCALSSGSHGVAET